MHITDAQLKEFLIDSGLISRSDISNAEQDAKKDDEKISTILIQKGKITSDDLRHAHSHILGIPFIDLTQTKVPFEVFAHIPEPVARKHNIVAFAQSPTTLEIALLDITDLSAIDFVKRSVGLKIIPRLTTAESMKEMLLQYQKHLKIKFGNLIQQAVEKIKNGFTNTEPLSRSHNTSQSSIISIAQTIIQHAMVQNATDIHCEPLENQILIRYRINGLLHDAMLLPKSILETLSSYLKSIANLRQDEISVPQNGKGIVTIDDEKITCRISIVPLYYGEKIVIKIVRESATGLMLEILGFHGDGLDRIEHAITTHEGIILTAGPTQSGKTTILYTLLDILNTPHINISTIENPIEYQMNRINQTSVRPDIGFTYTQGLRALSKQDSDIIMVGEIADRDTTALALHTSLTSRAVFSSIQALSAVNAIDQIRSMEIDPLLIASSLRLVIGTRLIRKLSNQKEKYFLSKQEIEGLGKYINIDKLLTALKKENIIGKNDTLENIPLYRPKKGSGDGAYSGIIGIHEVMTVSPSIKIMIAENRDAYSIQMQAESEGMLTIIEDGVFKAVQGLTSIEEVLNVTL